MSKPPFKVKAVYEYSSPHDDDLSFPNAQIINVTEEEDDDWYYGNYTDSSGSKREGLFPRNFVEKFEPETPPRPTRASRPKKETESQPPAPVSKEQVESEDEPEDEDVQEEAEAVPPPVAKAEAVQSAAPQVSRAPLPPSEPVSVQKSSNGVSGTVKSPPPPVAEKPTSGSFRDRIAAFNKTSAAPIAPFKPSSSGSSFIKKPFVAPPPSKNSYVPPPREVPVQKIYRREEDPDLVAENDEAPVSERSPTVAEAAEEDGQGKPTSLKDRIALLQKQQLEQAARHAESAQKKEKPKRPPKPRAESNGRPAAEEDDSSSDLQKAISTDTVGASREETDDPPRMTRRKSFKESPALVQSPPRELQSDANDADQSALDETTDNPDETSTGHEDSDTQTHAKSLLPAPARAPQAPAREADVGDEEDDTEEEEEEDVDPEVRRRMEIRERMAKMSGGMGMPGMFNPLGGMPPAAAKKKKSSQEAKSVETEAEPNIQAPPVPIMPMPGMAQVKSPPIPTEASPISEQEEEVSTPYGAPRRSLEADVRGEAAVAPSSPVERARPPSVPSAPNVRKSSDSHRDAPSLPIQTRQAPPVPAVPPTRRDPDSDDEAVKPRGDHSEDDDEVREETAVSRTSSKVPAPPGRPLPAPLVKEKSSPVTSPVSPSGTKRSSFVPPIPGTAAPGSGPQSRAPPPPPPGAPPPRRSTDDKRSISSPKVKEESEEEVTEYEGDYDTDIAPGATHKDALKSHAREASLNGSTVLDETPVASPVTSPPPRAIPPPPPSQPPRPGRQSSEIPRVPPPPPPTRDVSNPLGDEADDGDYDPYRYSGPKLGVSTKGLKQAPDEDLYEASPQESSKEASLPPPPPPPSAPSQPPPAPSERPPPPAPSTSTSRSQPRQSLDVPSGSATSSRRSADVPRSSMDQHATMAVDVDLAPSSQWWLSRGTPPPVFQNRRDLSFEVEENTATQRGGKTTVSKDIYVLFADYSQTVVTARFDPKDPASTQLSQRHEAPPPRLRQDQLEAAHAQYGAPLAAAANTASSSKTSSALGDGSALALVTELLKAHPSALPPIGTRAFGALVYANLANASVQQYDEIRPGDVLTLRNAKFQGHRGPVHQKYSVEAGVAGNEHVGIVLDWDGTKKKLRAFEQQAKGKVKLESWKVGDLRSGEVRVWRVVGRSWVGWEGQS